MTDASDTDDIETDLFAFAALQNAPAHLRDPQTLPPPAASIAPTAVNASAATPTVEIPAATSAPEPPDNDVLHPDWPRCRPKKQRAPRKFKRIADVPEMTREQLERSPKLMRYRELERNRLNMQAFRQRERAAKKRIADRKMRVCRACFRVFPPVERRLSSPYCNVRCKKAWERVKHCFDGEAAWLYRVANARQILSAPSGYDQESRMAAEYLLKDAAPDYSPYEPRPGTMMSALAKSLLKLRAKWAPHAAEAIRAGRADGSLRPDMLELLGPLIRRDSAGS